MSSAWVPVWHVLVEQMPGCASQADEARSPLHTSLLMTLAGTVLQHACSLFSHTFTCISARLSHTVWFVDYAGESAFPDRSSPPSLLARSRRVSWGAAGILLNFVWNAPAMGLLCWSRAAEQFFLDLMPCPARQYVGRGRARKIRLQRRTARPRLRPLPRAWPIIQHIAQTLHSFSGALALPCRP